VETERRIAQCRPSGKETGMNLLLTCLSGMVLLTTAGLAAQGFPATQVAAIAGVAPLDSAERRRTAEQLASSLAEMYLNPEIGTRYAWAVRSNLRRGAYRGLTDARSFAERLREDLQAVSPDVHLRLLPNEVFDHPREPDTPPKAGLPEGIEEMRMIGHTAYLRFTAFPHDPRTAPAARAFLVANAARTKAVVIDARDLPGGGIEVIDAMLPLFFAGRTVLASLETRAAGDKESPFPDGATLIRRPGRPGFVTRDHIVTPDEGEKRLRNVPLYYLTSSRTASAGEHLALVLKRTGRATLIGEQTRGAGHYVALAPVGTRLTALIPVGRAFDPATGRDWEGEGVSPDIAVPADRALDEALRRIRQSPAARKR
jgi:hypothetical protein